MNLCQLPTISDHSFNVIKAFVPFAAKVLLAKKEFSLLKHQLDSSSVSVNFDSQNNAASISSFLPFEMITRLNKDELKKIISKMDVPVDVAYKSYFLKMCVMVQCEDVNVIGKQYKFNTSITPPITAPESLYIKSPVAERTFISKLTDHITQIYVTMMDAFYNELKRFILILLRHFVDVENQDESVLLKDRVIGNYRYTTSSVPGEFNNIASYSDYDMGYYAKILLTNPLAMHVDIRAVLFINDEIVADSVLAGVIVNSNYVYSLSNNDDAKKLRKRVFACARLLTPKIEIKEDDLEMPAESTSEDNGYWSSLSF